MMHHDPKKITKTMCLLLVIVAKWPETKLRVHHKENQLRHNGKVLNQCFNKAEMRAFVVLSFPCHHSFCSRGKQCCTHSIRRRRHIPKPTSQSNTTGRYEISHPSSTTSALQQPKRQKNVNHQRLHRVFSSESSGHGPAQFDTESTYLDRDRDSSKANGGPPQPCHRRL